jgi:hypothetical protein
LEDRWNDAAIAWQLPLERLDVLVEPWRIEEDMNLRIARGYFPPVVNVHVFVHDTPSKVADAVAV